MSAAGASARDRAGRAADGADGVSSISNNSSRFSNIWSSVSVRLLLDPGEGAIATDEAALGIWANKGNGKGPAERCAAGGGAAFFSGIDLLDLFKFKTVLNK